MCREKQQGNANCHDQSVRGCEFMCDREVNEEKTMGLFLLTKGLLMYVWYM
jgi:hypothetical protein